MSQRLYAAVVAGVLFVALIVAAFALPVPYVVYSPGVTVDVLGERDGKEIIQVSGHQTYRDDGEMRMTTVYVTRPGRGVGLVDAVEAWLDDEKAIYPYDAVYAPDETEEDSRRESAVQMVSSQDAAIATALQELGYDTKPVIEVLDVTAGLPADGKLKVRDVLVQIGDTKVTTPQSVVDAVDAAPADKPLRFVVLRDGKRTTVEVTPTVVDGDKRIGIVPGPGFEFPFDVHVGIPDSIGGPSAGLMFSLAIYDTLTPGSLTGGADIAGTGTVTAAGKVGPIGGIQQKIVAARDAGASLFLVPAGNCDEALGAPHGDMRLVKATTMHGALTAVQAWTADHDADLPACTSSKAAG
ncbi:PDZ domain-containing protein [Nocardioides sp.]|uniref:YlbL family protein n=1 Tax=Nocardioides sp. TaxID=35761 RepID=UPI0035281BB9